jgi:high-affinity Fe2+/Pb2+ permease
MMRRYEQVSGVFFGLLAAVQLGRLLFRWPVQVASVSVPLWASVIAVVITGALATWAFRTASTLRPH